jgi:hypothetical protein
MALLGTGAICIWNDITPEGRADFYAWHVTEHIPERVGIPGFRRGRRYVSAVAGVKPEFFTLYEVEGPHVLTGQGYRSRLDAPTAWTRRATSGFRDTLRALTRVEASLGAGIGGALGTMRFTPRAGRHEEVRRVVVAQALHEMIGLPKMSGAHLCVTDLEASAQKSAESRDRNDIREAPAWIVLAEGCDAAAVADATRACESCLAGQLEDQPITNLFRLEYAL